MSVHLSLKLFLIMAVMVFSSLPGCAAERFSDNGDGTVTDHELGLMWSKTDNSGNINWIQAERWAKYTFPYSLAKRYGNWRLPTLKELQGLAVADEGYKGYETDCGLRVKIIPLIRLSCCWVWTSEEGQRAPTAHIFNFDNLSHYAVRKSQNRGYRALPVRDLE